ncbi:MAG: 4'-phosphopantetheinyl transferase superfamily protein [Gammaproteobacteria bacterium]|nr:4'-phosphopantetheinyl transferase superfamily protein [Gammaproteobacteria bacterium]
MMLALSGSVGDPAALQYCTPGTGRGIVPGIVPSLWMPQSLVDLSPAALAPGPGGVAFWYAAIGDWTPRQSDAIDCTCLDAAETTRALAISTTAAREEFVASRSLLRHVLGAVIGCAPRAVDLVLGAHGKPVLKPKDDVPDLHFNLSHSRGHWLLGVSRMFAIGVDIEMRTMVPQALRLASRVFSAAETRELETAVAAGESARDVVFLRTWTRKEAVLKAAGNGFSWPARELEVGAAPLPQRVSLQQRMSLPEACDAAALVWSLELPVVGHAAVALLGANGDLPPVAASYHLRPSSTQRISR